MSGEGTLLLGRSTAWAAYTDTWPYIEFTLWYRGKLSTISPELAHPSLAKAVIQPDPA
jgi:hypothetical protein